MTLGELINELAKQENPQDLLVMGLGEPMSYRGYYDQIGFPLEPRISIGRMLENAKSAQGATFEGYKGGYFEMGLDTDTWVAGYGRCGSELTHGLLDELMKHKIEVNK